MEGEWRKVKELVQIKGGKRLPKGSSLQIKKNDHPYIRVRDMEGRYLPKKGLEYVPDEIFPKIKNYIVEENNLLVSVVGTVGLISVVDTFFHNASQTENCTRLAGLDKQDALFLYYSLTAPSGQREIELQTVGAVQPKLPVYGIKNINVRWPEKSQRMAIAHVLGSLDDKIELNRRMNETLEGMAQALFKSWFVDFDPVIDNALAAGNPIPEPLAQRAETRRQALASGTANRESAQTFPASFRFTEELGWIPEGWEIGQISELFELHRGFDLSAKKRTYGLFPVYSAGGIHGMHNEYKMDPPGIITGRSGVIGNVYLSLTRYWPLNTTLYVRSFRKCGPFYALHFLRRLDLKVYNSGSAVPSLNRNYVHASETFIPSNEALEAFEVLLADLYKKIKANDEESKQLAKLRDVLLPKLISGELRIPQAEKMVEEAVA
ncbi:MAG: restriction endonuclease subunit S [Opitutae bacterium]|nr:restriction endonuclease subunit S [Opitutae bacterium]